MLYYLLVLAASTPLFFFLFKVSNFKRYPLSYCYYAGGMLFLTVGSFYGLVEYSDYYKGKLVSNEYLLVLLAFGLSPLIWLFARILIKKDSASSVKTIGDESWANRNGRLEFFYYTLLFLHVLYLLYYLWSGSAFNIAQAAFGQAGAKEIVELRSENAYGRGSSAIFIFYNVSYLLAAIRVSLWGGGRWTWLHLAYLAFCTCLFLHKSPIVYLAFVVLLSLVLRGSEVKWRGLAKFAVVSIVVVWGFYVLYFPGREWSFYFLDMPLAIFHRVFGVYSESAALTIRMEDTYGLLLGKTFINPLSIFSFEPIYLPRIIHIEMNGYPGNLSVPAVAEFYINFGLGFALVSVALLSLFFLFLDLMLARENKRDSFKCALLAYLAIGALLLSQSSIFYYLLEPKSLLLLFFMFLIVRLGIKRKNFA